jgi:glycosyltransferase involved in cell wall biosynthesis
MASIAIDGRKYFDFGIGTTIQQLIRSLSDLNSHHRFALYTEVADEAKIVLPPGWERRPISYKKYSIGEIVMFGRQIKKEHVDVFHEPHYTLPIGLRDCSVVTINDMIHVRFPEFFNLAQRGYAYAMIRHALAHSRIVITISDFTKNDILRSFGVKEEKIRAIPLGVGAEFRPRRDDAVLGLFRQKFHLQNEYILYVGNTKPHKGIGTLLEAYKGIHPRGELDLVFVGGSVMEDPILSQQIDRLDVSSRIHDLGRIASDDLISAYNGARCLVMPSLYEGFGLPVLEAMACGTPVITSDAAALPEVVGDSGLMFKAGNSHELMGVLQDLIRDHQLEKELIQKGLKRAQRFTWRNTARQTLDVYEEILKFK